MVRFVPALVLAAVASLTTAQETPAPPLPDTESVEEVEGPMTFERMARIIVAIDTDAALRGNAIEFTVNDIPVFVVADPVADRMRAMVPIRSAEGLDAAEMMRLMQANFDSALDARYAVAQGRVWGVFIHPLASLQRDQLLSGLAQTVNVARTYGETYSGGAAVFGGGDSNGIYQELLNELQKKGEEL
jgi:hypothetical protein